MLDHSIGYNKKNIYVLFTGVWPFRSFNLPQNKHFPLHISFSGMYHWLVLGLSYQYKTVCFPMTQTADVLWQQR